MKNNRFRLVKNKDGEKAITLIALVITIIVLLILARNFNINVKSEIMEFYKKLQMLKLKLKKVKSKKLLH